MPTWNDAYAGLDNNGDLNDDIVARLVNLIKAPKVWISDPIVGTGGLEEIDHPLGDIPARVVVLRGTATPGTHTAEKVKFTCADGVTCQFYAEISP